MRHSRISIKKQRLKYVLSDWLTGGIAFFLFNICRYYKLGPTESLGDYLFSNKLIIEDIIFPLLMPCIYWLSGYYNRPFGKSRLQEFLTTFNSSAINTVIIYFTLLINDRTGERILSYELIAILFGLLFLFTYFGRIIITQNTISHFKAHQWEFRTLIIGNSATARSTAKRLSEGQSRLGYHIIGYLSLPGEKDVADVEKVYSPDDIEQLCQAGEVDQFVIVSETCEEEEILNIVYKLYHYELPVKIAPDTYSFVTSAVRLNDIYADPFVDLTTPAMSEASKNVKRTMDVLLSMTALLLLSPLFAVISVLVKTESKGGVFYRQERIGRQQRPFMINKFRTMMADAEKEGPRLSEEGDPRITKTGRILRKYRLDELPQFWNVLKGEMSIVGPRPERAYYISQILERAPYYALVFQVRPGITSWGMVKFGYATNVDEMVERTRYDLVYISSMSLFVDLKIMIYTVKTIFTGAGM